jgi:hypothetical protein
MSCEPYRTGNKLPVPGKRRNRPFEVLELDLSGLATNQLGLVQVSEISRAPRK